ncbi:MAG: ABC transporter substrate-binding protein, partial [Candidatus Riflebacteria bacterium]|nr:ABC transporter substrate-binding protein [Candidatus Riflebacteria bacterium]
MQPNDLSRPAGREIIDMAGRQTTIPAKIKTIYSASYYGFTALCSIAPEMLPGLLQPLSDMSLKFLPSCLAGLPVIGMLPDTAGLERARPDLVVVWAETAKPFHKKSEDALNALNIPFVYVTMGDLANLPDYPDAYDFLGRLLNMSERTDTLASYCRQTLSEVETLVSMVPVKDRPRVYYAEGPEGLATEYDDSLHAHLLKLAGDVNVFRGKTTTHAGMEKVTIEQVAAADPDVIIALDRAFVANVGKDPAWKKVRAVREQRVLVIPSLPCNWFDRPPCFMRFIGLKWR